MTSTVTTVLRHSIRYVHPWSYLHILVHGWLHPQPRLSYYLPIDSFLIFVMRLDLLPRCQDNTQIQTVSRRLTSDPTGTANPTHTQHFLSLQLHWVLSLPQITAALHFSGGPRSFMPSFARTTLLPTSWLTLNPFKMPQVSIFLGTPLWVTPRLDVMTCSWGPLILRAWHTVIAYLFPLKGGELFLSSQWFQKPVVAQCSLKESLTTLLIFWRTLFNILYKWPLNMV